MAYGAIIGEYILAIGRGGLMRGSTESKHDKHEKSRGVHGRFHSLLLNHEERVFSTTTGKYPIIRRRNSTFVSSAVGCERRAES
jgi:hypothetical protein